MVLEIMLDKNLFEKAFLKRYKPEVKDNLATFTVGILKRTDHEKTSV